MEHIDPNPEALDEMRAADPDEPIVMLNMLKFRDVALSGFGVDGMSGRDAFMHYGALNDSEDVRYENEPFWFGPAHRTIIGEEQWDLVILVRYPSRRHFIDKVSDPKYLEISKVRSAALVDSRLVELTQLFAAS